MLDDVSDGRASDYVARIQTQGPLGLLELRLVTRRKQSRGKRHQTHTECLGFTGHCGDAKYCFNSAPYAELSLRTEFKLYFLKGRRKKMLTVKEVCV